MADITVEQVARARDASAVARNAHAINAALGALWYQRDDIPADVIAGWKAVGYRDLTAALTRWHAELVAAETPRKVARFKLGEWVQRPGSPPFRVRAIFEDSGGYVYCHAGHDTTGVRESALIAAADPSPEPIDGGRWASPAQCVDVLDLITRLRAAEARTADLRAGLERVVKRCAEGGDQALAEAQCALDWDDAAIPAPEAP